jgi:two-component SAPR family response regulator
MNPLKCISIDDDPLIIRKLEFFCSKIPWVSFEKGINNPVQGATAILSIKPDVIFLDVEMPYMDGEYLADWIQPKLDQLEVRPKIIVISSLDNPPDELLKNANGFINKSRLAGVETFEEDLKKILL